MRGEIATKIGNNKVISSGSSSGRIGGSYTVQIISTGALCNYKTKIPIIDSNRIKYLK